METLGFIPDDGYSEQGVILPIPGLYPRLAFEFRPMTMSQRADYFKGADKLNGMQLRRFAAGQMLPHLKRWDLKDRKGEVAPLDLVTLLKLKEQLFNRLFAIVSTDAPPDLEPDRTEAEKDEDLADVLKAAETGRPLAEVREERERKNSPGQ